MTVLTLWFLDKSNASSFASAASRPQSEKSMSVCSGWMPQRVMICGISEATDRMASAPSPSELLSTLRWGKARCQGALTERTLWGGGAPQVGDLRLLEDGSERRGALDSDRVAPDTAKHRWGWSGERVGVSMGADRKANAQGWRLTSGW